MSTTYCLRFDTGNAAFEDNGRDAEVAAVINRAADKIEREGLEHDFKLYDTNGNAIGRYFAGSPGAAADGEVLLKIETGNAAFEDDEAAEVLRILRHAAKRIAQGDWPAGLLDYNGNKVGSVEDAGLPAADERVLPDDAPAYTKLEAIRSQHPSVHFSTDSEEINALAEDSGLAYYSEDWSGIAVVTSDGEIVQAWVTESSRPFDTSAEFLQIIKGGRTMSWAKDHEEAIDAKRPYGVSH